MINLSQEWIDYLVLEPESGMGYQVVDITFTDGAQLENCIVMNCQHLDIPDSDKTISDIKVRKDFWYKKIEDNIRRDEVITLRLRQDGWKVFRFWDFEIKKDISACVAKITPVLL